MNFNKQKFKEVLYYIISKTAGDIKVGKTYLYKILYFSDFNHYEKYEELITGEEYRRIKMGPAPCHFDIAIKELIKEKKVKKKEIRVIEHTREKYYPCLDLEIDLTSKEKTEIDAAIKMITSFQTANQVSEFSHGDNPWKVTPENEGIDPELVFYRDPLYSVVEEIKKCSIKNVKNLKKN